MIRENIVYYLVCDSCRRSFIPKNGAAAEMVDGYFLSREAMLAAAEREGWKYEVMIHGNVTFYCPECGEKRLEKGGEA